MLHRVDVVSGASGLLALGVGAVATLQSTGDVTFSAAGIGIVTALLGGTVAALSFVFKQLLAAKEQQITDLRGRVDKQSGRLDDMVKTLTDTLRTTVAGQEKLMARTESALDGIAVVLERVTSSQDQRTRQASEEHLAIMELIRRYHERPTDEHGRPQERRQGDKA